MSAFKIPKIKIIFANSNVIVIDKPSGIMTHPDGRKTEYTISDWLKDYLKINFKLNKIPLKELGEEGREGIVHRLDTGTTGVMILALSHQAYIFLKKQFKAHTARKVYRAIVVGHIKNDTGIIDEAISRSRSDFRKKNTKDVFTNDGDGDVRGKERKAITRYKVIARLKTQNGNPYTYVECYPETGRTHQIRVHLKSIRHPILGDNLYGVGIKETEKINQDLKTKITHTLLHAYSLKIKIVNENNLPEEKTFIAKPHSDMQKVLKELSYKG